jgi:hypothetical protein
LLFPTSSNLFRYLTDPKEAVRYFEDDEIDERKGIYNILTEIRKKVEIKKLKEGQQKINLYLDQYFQSKTWLEQGYIHKTHIITSQWDTEMSQSTLKLNVKLSETFFETRLYFVQHLKYSLNLSNPSLLYPYLVLNKHK